MPDYAIVSVDDREGFIRNVPDPEAQRELSRNRGENFGSTYLEDHARFVPKRSMRSLGLESLLAFGAYILNDDDCRRILDLVPDSWQRHGRRDKDSLLGYLLRRSGPFVAEGVARLTRICQP